jgi:DNA-directed RNA polymerase specialized sigma24 family protein
MSDKEDASVTVWVQQLGAGDKEVPAQKLWERYFEQLVVLARGKMGALPRRAADEEDVALSAFASFCRGVVEGRFPDLNDRASLWRLLVTITVRKVYQLRLNDNCQKRGGCGVLDEAALAGPGPNGEAAIGLEQFISSEPTPEFAAQAAEEYRLLFNRLETEELRLVAQWKLESYTNDEIASKLGCALRTVERRLLLIRSLWSNP